MAAPVVSDDTSMTSQCMAFCQTLASQGKASSFALKIGESFSFSLDTREKSTHVEVVKKKMSPSAVRRNTKRKEEFLKKKAETLKKVDVNFEKETPENLQNLAPHILNHWVLNQF